MTALPPTPCLVGATASGKTAVARELARRTAGEVIACDAFTVYRDMDVLSAAPGAADDVFHHLVGTLDPAKAWSASAFVEAADAKVSEVRSRGHTPWIVGGTALYLRAWLKGFGAPVGRDAPYRLALETEAEEAGRDVLHARLETLDPVRARELHPNDLKRVIRALEIIRATGRPASGQRGEWGAPDRRPAVVFALRRRPEDLEARIRRRTEQMFEEGVVEEARRLEARTLSPEASMVLGLDVLERLLSGELDGAEAREAIVRQTRRLARKQGTFFRSFAAARWIDVPPEEAPAETAARILDQDVPAGTYTSA